MNPYSLMIAIDKAEVAAAAAFKKEMKDAGVKVDFKTYPGALHGFTNPDADEMGRKFSLAIGYNAEKSIIDATPQLRADRNGLIVVDRKTGQTSRQHIFAGGDNVNGADLVVTALADARRAAHAIHDFLTQ